MYGCIWNPTLWSYRQIRNKHPSCGWWDPTTTKRSSAAPPFCRNTMVLRRWWLFSPGLCMHLRTKLRSRQLSKTNSPDEVGAEGTSDRTTHPLQLEACRGNPAAGLQPTQALVVTFLQNWCSWVTMANRDGNNHYWWCILLYRRVSNPAALYMSASVLHTWKALYEDSAVLDSVRFIDLAGEQEGERLPSSLKTMQLLQLEEPAINWLLKTRISCALKRE